VRFAAETRRRCLTVVPSTPRRRVGGDGVKTRYDALLRDELNRTRTRETRLELRAPQ
jgi:hypothetical protein